MSTPTHHDTRPARQFNYGRFLLVMFITVWAARSLFGDTWQAAVVAVAVNLVISWPRRPKTPTHD